MDGIYRIRIYAEGLWVFETVRVGILALQGYLDHKKQRPPLGPPQGPRHQPTVGSLGGAVSCERGTPVPDSARASLGTPALPSEDVIQF